MGFPQQVANLVQLLEHVTLHCIYIYILIHSSLIIIIIISLCLDMFGPVASATSLVVVMYICSGLAVLAAALSHFCIQPNKSADIGFAQVNTSEDVDDGSYAIS